MRLTKRRGTSEAPRPRDFTSLRSFVLHLSLVAALSMAAVACSATGSTQQGTPSSSQPVYSTSCGVVRTAASLSAGSAKSCVARVEREVAQIRAPQAGAVGAGQERRLAVLRSSVISLLVGEAAAARTLSAQIAVDLYQAERAQAAQILGWLTPDTRPAAAVIAQMAAAVLADDSDSVRRLMGLLVHSEKSHSDLRITNIVTQLVEADDSIARRAWALACAGRPSVALCAQVQVERRALAVAARLPRLVQSDATGKLRWSPPTLHDPKRITVTSRQSVYKLDNSRDYLITLGRSPVRTGVRLQGGHDIVIVGGQISPSAEAGEGYQAGLFLDEQSAGSTVYVEGVRFAGDGLDDGIGIQDPAPNTTVVLQDIRVDDLRPGDTSNFSQQHPDIIQTDSGPTRLEVDRLTGYTPYQGFFFEPDDLYSRLAHNIPTIADLRNVDLHHNADVPGIRSDMLWQSTPFQLDLGNVYIAPGNRPSGEVFVPNALAWRGVKLGVPKGGDFVPPGTAGVRYRSPGYQTGHS